MGCVFSLSTALRMARPLGSAWLVLRVLERLLGTARAERREGRVC